MRFGIFVHVITYVYIHARTCSYHTKATYHSKFCTVRLFFVISGSLRENNPKLKRNILHLILFEIEYLKERSASMPGDNFENLVQQYGSDVAQRTEKYNRLKELDIFVLDNSIRESTVGK